MSTNPLLDMIQGVASAPELKVWPVPLFVDGIEKCQDESMETFVSSKIIAIWCYRSTTHEYLMVCVAPSTSMKDSLWLRIERRPEITSASLIAKSSSNDLLANDTVTVSFSVQRLRDLGLADRVISQLVPDNAASGAEVRHLLGLLRIVEHISPRYTCLSFNCRWFARVIVRTLQLFRGGTDMAAPMSNTIDRLMGTIGKDTKQATQDVWDSFVRLFHPSLLGRHIRLLSNESTASFRSSLNSTASTPSLVHDKELPAVPSDSSSDTHDGSLRRRRAFRTSIMASSSMVPLSDLIQRVIVEGDLRERRILVRICATFVSDIDFLNASTSFYASLREVLRAGCSVGMSLLQNRVRLFITEWATDVLTDVHVIRDVVSWMRASDTPVPFFLESRIQGPLNFGGLDDARSRRSSSSEPSRRRAPRPVAALLRRLAPTPETHFEDFDDEELRALSRELHALEMRTRSTVPQSDATTWLRHRHRYQGSEIEALGDDPTKPLREELIQICHWVVSTVLDHKDIQKRARAYNRFALLVKMCLDDSNISSAHLILAALSSPFLRDLEHTTKIAGVDQVIAELRERIPQGMSEPSLSVLLCSPPRRQGPLYPVDALMKKVIELNDSMHVGDPLPSVPGPPNPVSCVNWTTCVQLQNALDHLLPTQLSTSSSPSSDISQWFVDGLKSATAAVTRDQSVFKRMSKELVLAENKEWGRWQRRSMGFNT